MVAVVAVAAPEAVNETANTVAIIERRIVPSPIGISAWVIGRLLAICRFRTP
jgi:hypothetical protein